MKLILFTIYMLCSTPHATASEKFNIDGAHSKVGFSINHLGIIPVDGVFKKFTGTLTFSKNNKLNSVQGRVDVDSIDTNEEDRDAHLKNDDFFGVRDKNYDIVEKKRYMNFKSTKIEYKNEAPHKIHGNLTINGKTKKTAFDINWGGVVEIENTKRIGLTATTKIDRRDFGLSWQKPTTGIAQKVGGLFVGNEVKIELKILALSDTKPKK